MARMNSALRRLMKRGGARTGWLTVALLAILVRTGPVVAQTVLDDFEDLSGWSASASDGTHVWVTPDAGHTGMGMRIGFDLNAGGGYLIVRKTFSLPLPANYAFSFYLRGEGPQNNLEFKLLDSSGKNVWWRKQRDFVSPAEWQRISIRKSRIEFAWGPSNRELKRVGAIEFALSASAGGKGAMWIDDLQLEEREPATHDGLTPTVTASTSVAGHEAPLIFDHDPHTSWKSAPVADHQEVLIDLLKNWEYGGLLVDWEPDDYATAYQVQVSHDGAHWTTAYSSTAGHGGRDYIYMPDAESRYIKFDLERSSRGQGYGIAEVTVEPFEFSASPNQFFTAIARDAAAGTYPKYFYGKQTYWTVIGAPDDDKEALLNEEGMLEVDKGAFSIEPFLYVDGQLINWNTVHTAQQLEAGYLPIPSVTWQHNDLTLKITAFANGPSGVSTLYARYRIDNRGEEHEHVRLFLAIRPFQVNPPWQSLNMTGGVTTIREIRIEGRTVWVNRDKAVISLTTPDRFGAATFDQGAITDFLQAGRVPPQSQVSDVFGFASGALQYTLEIDPDAAEEVYLAVPFHEPYAMASAALAPQDVAAAVGKQLEDSEAYWRTVLRRVEIQLPPAAEKIAQAVKTTLAYILINRDGAAIQPGSRNYARSWIRDGALTSAALLEMGCTPEVRDFIRWFVGYQSKEGKIPCCVDRRGADPVPENDSNGEFIYAVMEYYRYTHDVGFVQDMWSHVVSAVDYLSALRRKRMTSAYETPENAAFYGLLPESISHEGYTASPVHSYWDDFFALRGFKDAASLAVVVGDDERAASFASLRDAFRHDLSASIAKAMAQHGIDYIPGSVELGDFDATSTAIAVDPGGELADLPQAALLRTFERYYRDFEKRRNGDGEGTAYTPYELRNVATLVRMGQRERAFEILTAIVADQRPPAWNEWAEVIWRDTGAPNFIGDMPHTWVGSSFIHSVRSLFAYERESDGALVIAAGLPSTWTMAESGVGVKRLPTHYGVLNYTLHSDGPNRLRAQLSGDLTLPPGKIVLDPQPPLLEPLRGVTVNGRPVQSFTGDTVTISEFPADVVLEYGASAKEEQ
jgi:hypothetical protein